MKHSFGGLWTQKKLLILEQYLDFYATAMKKQPFTLHYVDAFAGTGSHDPEEDAKTQAALLPAESLEGSVTKALEVIPAFDHYHFNDINQEHISALKEVKNQNPDKKITITELDANEFVPKFCQSLTYNDRAVLFLDPYSTQLDWITLNSVASSKKVDLWLLFPISIILRMTPKENAKVRPEWAQTITRLLGTPEWENALYKPTELNQSMGLFDEPEKQNHLERININELQKWVTSRLQELFPYVAKPVPLKDNGKTLFLFFFAVSNPNKAAWGLANKAASHIILKNS